MTGIGFSYMVLDESGYQGGFTLHGMSWPSKLQMPCMNPHLNSHSSLPELRSSLSMLMFLVVQFSSS